MDAQNYTKLSPKVVDFHKILKNPQNYKSAKFTIIVVTKGKC